MRIAQLWRHPVKSMQGERLDQAVVEQDGFEGDRRWGVIDNETGRILTGRRQPELLMASAELRDGAPLIELPDGQMLDGPGPATDAALSAWLAKDVALVESRTHEAVQAEFFSDATNDNSMVIRWTLPEGRFVDVEPLLVVTSASLRMGASLQGAEWDVRRFRPNVVVETEGDGWVEDAWVDRPVRLGDIEAMGVARCPRCTMVTRPQPELTRDLDVFKTLAREHNADFGLWARVAAPGVIRVGDPVTVA